MALIINCSKSTLIGLNFNSENIFFLSSDRNSMYVSFSCFCNKEETRNRKIRLIHTPFNRFKQF